MGAGTIVQRKLLSDGLLTERPCPLRYLRPYGGFLRTCLVREMMFRGNFLLRCSTHILWLTLMLVFFEVVFLHTPTIGDWDKYAYMFFLGTSLTLNALLNCLFINGCTQISESIRTGSLDFALLKPVDSNFCYPASASIGQCCRRCSSA